jgi:thymidylate synthase (FAD)
MNEIVFKTIEDCAVELAWRTNVDDFAPAHAARVSYARDKKKHTTDDDIKLIKYLAKHKHFTPFEYQHATLMIECPLFIRSQIHRHRTFSYNEISRRYTSDELGFWIPTSLRVQDTKDKQGSVPTTSLDYDTFVRGYKHRHEEYLETYNGYISLGIAREQARAELPQSLLTRFYMAGNLRNWTHFLELRLDSHAQYEVRVIAQKCKKLLESVWPISLKAIIGE